MENGAIAANVDLCGDADDMFIDERRQQLYVSCGDGALDVFDVRQRSYPRKARIASRQLDIPDPRIRGCALRDPGLGKFLDQASPEGVRISALSVPATLTNRRNVFDSKPVEPTANVGEMLPCRSCTPA